MPPRQKYKGREWYKTETAIPFDCKCCLDGHRGVPGIIFPINWDDAGASVDGRVFIDRCDACALFRSAVCAADFVSALLGVPWKKLFDNEEDPYFHPYFEITVDQALNLRFHASSVTPESCIACINEK